MEEGAAESYFAQVGPERISKKRLLDWSESALVSIDSWQPIADKEASTQAIARVDMGRDFMPVPM